MKRFYFLSIVVLMFLSSCSEEPLRSVSDDTPASITLTPEDPCPYSPFHIVFDNGLENFCGTSLVEMKIDGVWYFVTEGTPYNGRIVYGMWTEGIPLYEFRGTWKKDHGDGCSGGTVKIQKTLVVNQSCP